MIRSKARFRRERVTGILLLAAMMGTLLVYWWLMTNFVVRDFWDPQYALKSERLQARIKEYPGHPLWLVMGGSRVEAGVRPQLLLESMRGKSAPILFNFGLSGADLFRQSICLKRLIEDGVKPKRVLVEIMGPLMRSDESYFISNPSLLVRARRDEIDEYCSYSPEPAVRREEWQSSRINPLYKYGMKVPHQTLSLRLIPVPLVWRLEKHFYDPWGWVTMPEPPISESEYRRGFEISRNNYSMLNDTSGISKNCERILRGIIGTCDKAGIELFLLQMPEGKDFQALYSERIDREIESLLEKMHNEFGVRRINARSWITGDAFTDGHHLNAEGGAEFTRRLAGELLATGP